MLKRFGVNFTLFLLACDLILTDLALYLARHLRLAVDLGVYVGPEGEWLRFDPLHYLVVPFVWLVIFNPVSYTHLTLPTN